MRIWGWLRDEHNRGALALIGGGIAAIVGAGWAIFLYMQNSNPTNPEPVCAYIAIRALGWEHGHKTNFCRAAGYEVGNFNQGEYSNGGICLTGPNPEICREKVQNRSPAGYVCKTDGLITSCFEQ